MPVDPRLALLTSTAPPAAVPGTPAERRELAHAMAAQMAPVLARPGPDMADVTDRAIDVEGGTIVVRVYRPVMGEVLPAMVYAHGGGWWMGTLDMVDNTCRRMANIGGVVVSIDYRLAPEHPFPVPLEDVYAAVLWVATNAADLMIDPDRIAIGGGNAGANLAAATTLLARERGRPALCGQVLEVPAVDLTGSHPSFGELGTGYGLTKDDILECVSFYAPGADLTAPLLSPVFADLSGLPPALIATAEFDPLRDEGEAYARRLQDAGVDCTLKRFAGMLHGSMSLDALVPDVADEMGDDVAAFLRRVWAL